jgi:hypothetical protein
MVTNLIAGVAVPSWDRALFLALREAVLGMPEQAPLRVLNVLNGDRQVYRQVVAHGTLEHQAMLQCFAERGFVVDTTEEDALVHLPEPSALKTAGAS